MTKKKKLVIAIINDKYLSAGHSGVEQDPKDEKAYVNAEIQTV